MLGQTKVKAEVTEELTTVELLAQHRAESEKKNAATFECDAYESAAYWDSRYSDPAQSHGSVFEWYDIQWKRDIAHRLSHFIVGALEQQVEVHTTALVDLGCGNSSLVFDMATCVNLSQAVERCRTSPVLQFVGVDVSSVVVESNKELATTRKMKTCSFHQVDLTSRVLFKDTSGDISIKNSLPFEAGFASFVIDKATFDALDCSDDATDVLKATENAQTMLHNGGILAIITCRPVKARLAKLNKCKGFSLVEVISLENDPLAPSHVIVLQKNVQ